MDAAERARYDRHLRLAGFGEEGQRRLRAASVLVVGVGGLGCPVAQSLAAAGVGRLTLLDGDSVALENLHRQTLFGDKDVGVPKAEAAAKRLRALSPLAKVRPVVAWLDAEGAGAADAVVAGHDLVVDATDQPAARRALNDACQRAGVPLVHGALHASDGQVAVFPPGGPCHRCLFPALPEAEDCAQTGVLGPLASLVGTQMALEAVKVLAGYGEPLSGRLLLVDGRTSRFEEVRFTRRPGCPACASAPAAAPAPSVARREAPARTASTSPPASRPLDPDPLDDAELQVDAAAFRRLQAEGALVLDVRTPEEAARRGVPGSLQIHVDELSMRLGLLPRGTPILVVCSHGRRGLRAARLLRRHGFDARSVRGGLAALRVTS